jgi:hypothetical protein
MAGHPVRTGGGKMRIEIVVVSDKGNAGLRRVGALGRRQRLIANPDGKSNGRRPLFGRTGRDPMKKFRVRYETKILEGREGTEIVSATG